MNDQKTVMQSRLLKKKHFYVAITSSTFIKILGALHGTFLFIFSKEAPHGDETASSDLEIYIPTLYHCDTLSYYLFDFKK
jgi:hypothetical protein